jgi:hypothetical protein
MCRGAPGPQNLDDNMQMNGKLLGAGALLLMGACADLEVNNLNEPDRTRALATAGDLEALGAGAYRTNFFAAHSSSGPALALALSADEYTSSAANFAGLDFYQEPRQPVNNTTTYNNASILRHTWASAYSAISSSSDVLKALQDQKVAAQLGAQRTARLKTIATFNQGLGLGWLGLTYDRAFIVDETTDLAAPVPLSPYTEVVEKAIKKLYDAAELAEATSWSTEPGWFANVTLSNTQIKQLAFSYAARFRAQVARTPEERNAVNWAQVIQDANKGITADYNPVMDDEVWWDYIKVYPSFGPFGWWDMRYAGMADSTGGYQAWMATPMQQRQPFQMASPDKRFPSSTASTGAGSKGKYVGYQVSTRSQPGRGTFQWSNYRDFRFQTYFTTFEGAVPDITVREMRLLRAEGLYRQGNLKAAADSINVTRVGNGGLDSVTVNGVPNTPRCVPRLPNGQCGTLFDALKWEKRVEIWMHYLGDWFFDSRAWGDLQTGAPLHLPVPASDLLLAGEELYTFGGVGGRCASGTPTNCIGGSGTSAAKLSPNWARGVAERAGVGR